MKYAINPDSPSRLVMCTSENPGPTEEDYVRVRGARFYTLEEAIALGATTTNSENKQVWLGVNIEVKIEDKMLYAWWLGKWRCIREWTRKTQPSDKWVQEHVENTMRLNIPLDPATVVIWHWKTAASKPRPIPENGACSFQVDGQWYITTFSASRIPHDSNKDLVKTLLARGYVATTHGNFIHLTPPDWA